MTTNDNNQEKPATINVYEEHANIDKEVVEKGKVRITKKVHKTDEQVQIDTRSEEVRVERIPINKYVSSPPPVRYEGNTTIISVVKEVAVVEKKILVVEEVHITKEVKLVQQEKSIPLMKEEVIVETSRDNAALNG